jgi:predicted membrane chloride channel (bestrophin family)
LFIPTEVVIISSAIPISGTIPICSSTIPVSYWLSLLLNAFECFMLPFQLMSHLLAAAGGEGEEEEE